MGKGGEMKCIKLLIDAWSSKITKTINEYGTLDVVPNFEDCNLKIPVDEKADLKVVIVIAPRVQQRLGHLDPAEVADEFLRSAMCTN